MIALERRAPPAVLAEHGQPTTRRNCGAYLQNQAEYDSGRSKLNFDSTIYGSPTIRELLEQQQHGKCCYCESTHSATSAGRIDHFRPKGAVRQDKTSARSYPGYYWLAYEWHNLVLACEKCNRHKSDYFPIEEPGQRARNHLDQIECEAPLLLNPYADPNPSRHLAFEGSACRPLTEQGRVTVTVLGLNRPELQEKRQTELNVLTLLRTVAREPDRPGNTRQRASDFVQSRTRPDAPYTAMVRHYLRQVGAESENRE